MLDRMMLYNTIYALAARDGREATLFGSCAPLARQALARSLAGIGFPELWFELPLSGDPWFDLHALASHEHLDPDMTFAPRPAVTARRRSHGLPAGDRRHASSRSAGT